MTTRRGFVAGMVGGGWVAGAGLASMAAGAAEAPANDWTVQPPDAQGIDPAALQEVLDAAQAYPPMRSVLVVRNGILIGERYVGRTAAAALQGVNSATKSVASMLVGIALQQGRIRSVSATLAELLPDAATADVRPEVRDITLEQILTGTTGLAYDYRTQMASLADAADPIAFALGLPLDTRKPTPWVYNDAAVALLAPILVRAHGMRLEDVAQRDLLHPLGIDTVGIDRDKAGNAVTYRGLRLRARDFARIAWVMANDGRWSSQQIVPEAWVRESTRFHVPGAWTAGPVQQPGYGYLWFTGQLQGRPMAWAWGYGAQFALVVPSLRLAVTTTATNPRPADLVAQNNAVMTLVARIVALAS